MCANHNSRDNACRSSRAQREYAESAMHSLVGSFAHTQIVVCG